MRHQMTPPEQLTLPTTPRPAGMPRWLRTMLENKGVLGTNGLSANARIHTCRTCRMPTLSGWDADVGAFDAWCDLAELSTEGELLALLDGRRTYYLNTHRNRIYRRTNAETIRVFPAGDAPLPPHLDGRPRYDFQRYPVFAEHRCNEPIPATWAMPDTPEPATEESAECPF